MLVRFGLAAQPDPGLVRCVAVLCWCWAAGAVAGAGAGAAALVLYREGKRKVWVGCSLPVSVVPVSGLRTVIII